MQEKMITNSPEPQTKEETRNALQQLQYSICKIFKANATGFFCYIPYENKNLKVLMTNYHAIDELFIKVNDNVKIGINDEKYFNDINLNVNRNIYLNKEYDLAIIEIKDKDHLNENIAFLNLDEDIFQRDSESIFSTKNTIYILQYPNLGKARISWGIIKEINRIEIKHSCSTDFGSSGSPILYIKTNKVIGIHKGRSKFNFNLGTFLKKPLTQLYQNHEMKPIYQIKNNNNFNQCSYNFTYNMINNVFLNHRNNNVNSFGQNNIFSQLQSGNKYKNNNQNYNKIFQENIKKYEKTIEDGIYYIIPVHCNNKAIDINGSSTENYANLQLYEYNNSNAQKFEVKYNSKDNYYTIMCLCSNKLLTVNSNDNNIVQYDEIKGINQQWHIARIGDNYEIISEYKGYLMDVTNKGVNNCTNISCKPKTGELNQQFKFNNVIKYFPKPSYNENSIVDALKAINVDSSQSYRSKIAAVNGIENYNYLPEQNMKMLKLLKNGQLIMP